MKNINQNCFAAGEKCSVLTGQRCEGCRFFKTKKQISEERHKSVQRLKRLGKWESYKETYNLLGV